MRIIAHRGYWQYPAEKNTRRALNKAFMAGYGIETDIRDLDGELVVSHDMPRSGALPLALVLDDYVRAGQPNVLALNIKADGLAGDLQRLLALYGVQHYFCFDMSVPDTLPYLQVGLTAAARLSEYEPEGMLSGLASTLWVDGFQDLSVSPERLHAWLLAGKQICLVSPELHGRDPQSLWTMLAALPVTLRHHPNLMLCTDRPKQAEEAMA